jgi:long-chain acyl-CoA synthetase
MPSIREDLDRKVAGQTITGRFVETSSTHPDRVALRAKSESGGWDEWTWRDYADHVSGATAYLQGLGVQPGDRVVLMFRNIPDFHMVDLAVKFCGATPVSIYNSSAPEQVQYLVEHCGAKVAVVEDEGFAERFRKVQGELPALEHLISFGDDIAGEFFHGGSVDLAAAAGNCTPETLATIIYTSGTTGPPKGVMLDHANIMWTCQAYMEMLQIDPVGFRTVSYLPMAHIAERMSTHYLALFGGYEVTCCPDPAQLVPYFVEVRPEIAFGVPRVWEKLYAALNAAIGADAEAAAKFEGALALSKQLLPARTKGTMTDEQAQTWAALDEAAFRPIRARVGLDACQFAVTGAAPIPAEMLEWFRAIGLPLSEIYGMSESSGPMTWEPYEVIPGSVGKAFYGVEVRLAEDGEIICRGGNVFRGYLNQPEKTAEALDEDGWLHSGDIGTLDDEGYFRVVDRKKELIITAGGKNISPANLEAALKMIPLVGQACAIGDGRPFVSALVVLDAEAVAPWAAAHGLEGASLAELAEHPDVIAEIEAGRQEVMAGFNNAEAVKKVKILHDEWLPDGEELTPTSKLKRRGIHAKYADEIAALYS